MLRSTLVSLAFLAIVPLAQAAPPAARAGSGSAAAASSVDWKREFEEICAKTQDAMTLPTEELKSLVERCDKLVPALAALGESEQKVYSRRLKACRDLYAYVLDARAGK